MHRLAFILFAMIGVTLAGSAIVVMLVLGFDTLTPIVVAAVLGFAVAVPASIAVARRLTE
ncbi:MAG: CTP synthetase [Pseudomonadota bacterium]